MMIVITAKKTYPWSCDTDINTIVVNQVIVITSQLSN